MVTSTVLDTAVFLLLVGAAVATLAVPAHHREPGSADETADVLATSTARLNYSLVPSAKNGTRPVPDRTAHGTLAGHLARAAVRNATIDSEPAAPASRGYGDAVANATRNATRQRDRLVRVRAVWRPYPGAPIRGRVAAGPTPPPTADVHASTLVVGNRLRSARERAPAGAREGGYRGVALLVASSVIDGFFPERRTRLIRQEGGPSAALVECRYRRFANLTGARIGRNVTAANERLVRALTAELAADMHGQFGTPGAAGESVTVGRVRITVRTWSP